MKYAVLRAIRSIRPLCSILSVNARRPQQIDRLYIPAWREARDAAEKRMMAPPRKITFNCRNFAPYLDDLSSDHEIEMLFLEFLQKRAKRRILDESRRNGGQISEQDKIQLFGNQKICAAWDAETEDWYFSVVDVVAVLTDSRDPAAYWRKLKQRMREAGPGCPPDSTKT